MVYSPDMKQDLVSVLRHFSEPRNGSIILIAPTCDAPARVKSLQQTLPKLLSWQHGYNLFAFLSHQQITPGALTAVLYHRKLMKGKIENIQILILL